MAGRRENWSVGNSDKSVPHTRIEDESMVEENYKFGRKLGQGTFGVVHEATDIRTGKQWAVKVVNKEKVITTIEKLKR